MRIAILGTGRMARALGTGWLKAGHKVAFGSRTPEFRNEMLEDVGEDCRVYGIEGAITFGDVVVIAVPYVNVAALAARHADLLRGKPVIDISNPMFANRPADGRAGAELTAEAIGEGAVVLAAFKDNFSGTLLDPVDHTGEPRDVHCAGDNKDARDIVAGLVEDLGFRPVDCGPLSNAAALDLMVPLMIELDERYNGGRSSSWRFASPPS